MKRIVISPDAREHVRTVRRRDASIWDGTVEFDATGTSKELPDEVADEFVDTYNDTFSHEGAADDAPPVDELAVALDGTVDEVEAAIESGEYDERLGALEAQEQAGADRKTVYEAVEARRHELSDEENEE